MSCLLDAQAHAVYPIMTFLFQIARFGSELIVLIIKRFAKSKARMAEIDMGYIVPSEKDGLPDR